MVRFELSQQIHLWNNYSIGYRKEGHVVDSSVPCAIDPHCIYIYL